MNILMYCNYIFGIGHLVRTSVIANELKKDHNVIILCGGSPIGGLNGSSNPRYVWLDPILADEAFERYHAPDGSEIDFESVIKTRTKKIRKTAEGFKPDIFWVEAFPFARKKFRKEIISSIEHIRNNFPSCKIVSSVRDILLKYGGDEKYRQKTSAMLNEHFDMLFVHSDKKAVPLELTYGPTDAIKIPMIYTGYVCRKPKEDGAKMKWEDGGDIIVSNGGSFVGSKILKTALECHKKYLPNRKMTIFASPTGKIDDLNLHDNVHIRPFTWEYIDHLNKSALSISMGGYNSVIEAIATSTPTVLVPYGHNSEQIIRAKELDGHNLFHIVPQEEMTAESLYKAICEITLKTKKEPSLDLNGAQFVRQYFTENIQR